jgi:hypothetical protein
LGCLFLCFFWLIFLSRDPWIAVAATVSVVAICFCCPPVFTRYGAQIGLVSLLVHSLRWDDRNHRGAVILRNLAGLIWVWFSYLWLRESVHEARLPVYSAAAVILVVYGVRVIMRRGWKPGSVPVYAVLTASLEPGRILTENVREIAPGFLAIGASFVLFAVGSLAAFAKAKNKQTRHEA